MVDSKKDPDVQLRLRTKSTKSSSGTKHKAKKKRPILNFAPLNTPLRNRLETLGVIWHTISIPFFCVLFLLVLSFGSTSWLAIVLPYFVWWYGFDLHTPSNGKVVYRTRDWMKNLLIWTWFVNYFPIRVHKSVELEPTFSDVLVEDETPPDDEEDLISEDSRTIIDKIFKKLGLSKRLNDIDSYSPPPTNGQELKPEQYRYKKISTGPRYIFGYHPHGVISMGAMGLFATNALRNEPFEPPMKFMKPFFHDPSKGKRLLPGIGYVFPLTLTTQFTLPFYRDYLLSLGLTSASAKNIKSIINNGDNSVCIVVGGAQESLLNNMVTGNSKIGNGYKGGPLEEESLSPVSELPDDEKPTKPKRQIKLVLNKRKGFVKIAIELGNVSLVPTFAFGEADIYKLTIPKPGSYGYIFQQWMKKHFSFTLPFFRARGVFVYDFGFLPYRNPIDVVMGHPIHVPPGLVAEYKLEHPEFDPSRSTLENTTNDNKKIGRKDSLTNLFKAQSAPEKKPVRPKIPQEIVDHYHRLYVDELKRVYEDNKHKYGYGDVELCIIE